MLGLIWTPSSGREDREFADRVAVSPVTWWRPPRRAGDLAVGSRTPGGELITVIIINIEIKCSTEIVWTSER